MFSLICVWINGWENIGNAGDLRRHRAHYDATVMACNVYNFILCTLGYIPIKTQQTRLLLLRGKLFDNWTNMSLYVMIMNSTGKYWPCFSANYGTAILDFGIGLLYTLPSGNANHGHEYKFFHIVMHGKYLKFLLLYNMFRNIDIENKFIHTRVRLFPRNIYLVHMSIWLNAAHIWFQGSRL